MTLAASNIVSALLRHLDAEQIEHFRDEHAPANASASILVSEDSLPRIPATLNEFCRRNDFQLVHYWPSETGELYTLSCLNAAQRPEFFSLLVRTRRRANWLRNKLVR